ncbi:DUF262 domain-containing protein [Clostridium beijerinckii]|uniref:GmrSD restriction endonucleases N-terminal domain-containing protein n=1 Tax=Clostridium beijerinckii TaxID=1520 RepID=A0AAX0BBE1_CLOBE|nr:DUF262 domain-containing protein [Clostridium beijerinckii]NRT92352.1 hypothetical protein [Clostridium beijerinckii]NYC75505.1 hypothetical protein [Clostridium beijerinckii]
MNDAINNVLDYINEQEIKITENFYCKKLKEVIRNIAEGSIVVPLDQREYVWTQKEKSNFVGKFLVNFNLLKSCKLNHILLLTTPDEKIMYICDGQQRITSLIDYLYTSKVETDELYKDSINDLLELLKKRTKNNKVLNADIDKLGFKISTRYMENINDNIKKTLNGKKASDLDEELIKKVLNSTIVLQIIIGEKDDIDKLISMQFLNVNSGVPVTEAEKTKSKFCRTMYYMSKMELVKKLQKYIKIKDKNNTKLLTLLIDIDRARNGQYSSSHKLRNKFIEEKKEDLQYINQNNELTIKITNILLDIFGENYMLVEFNNKNNCWNSTTNSTIALPWYLAIEELLNKNVKENVFEQKRIHILERWKGFKFETGRKNDEELRDRWMESKTDHSSNKNKVIDRKNMIISLLKDSIK